MTYGALIIINQKRSGKIIQHIKLAKINVITPRIIIGLIFTLPVKLLQKNPLVKYNNIVPCGITDKKITNLKEVKDLNYKDLDKKIINNFIKNLEI